MYMTVKYSTRKLNVKLNQRQKYEIVSLDNSIFFFFYLCIYIPIYAFLIILTIDSREYILLGNSRLIINSLGAFWIPSKMHNVTTELHWNSIFVYVSGNDIERKTVSILNYQWLEPFEVLRDLPQWNSSNNYLIWLQKF